MNTEIQTDDSVSKTSTDTINIGKRLIAKRLELEFDERYVATILKISIDQVRALEANNFQFFRSVTFARGFLKSYCRLLGIDHSEVLHAFDDERKGAESTIKPVDKVNKQTHLGDPFVIFISVVIVAILIFLVFWWPSQSSQIVSADNTNDEVNEIVAVPETETIESVLNETVAIPETETIESVLNESNEPVPISNVSSLNSSTETTLEKNDFVEDNAIKNKKTSSNDGIVTGLTAETMAILEEAGVSPAEVVRATAAAPQEPVVIREVHSYSNDIEMIFDKDCWTEVRDVTGKILFSGVKSAGSKLVLTGNAPYRVVLGYAEGVSSLKYKGEVFDFSSFTRKNLARFELK